MGYTTYYKLDTMERDKKYAGKCKAVSYADFVCAMRELNLDEVFGCMDELEEEGGEGFIHMECDEWIKWYEHDRDMLDISMKFPDTVFVLSGEGEESGDLWKTYYKNGVKQDAPAIITYPECTL